MTICRSNFSLHLKNHYIIFILFRFTVLTDHRKPIGLYMNKNNVEKTIKKK